MEQKAKVLVVDDNSQNLEVISYFFKEYGYAIALANSGKMALETLQSEDFDLIVLDVMLPGMDGFEICSIIRNKLKLNIPVIFLTAKVEKSDIVNGFKVGGQDYVTKPFESTELIARANTQVELYRSKKELAKLNQSLEDKVKKRTNELEKVNSKLRSANKKLIQLDEAKYEFLKIISHEIRTPLNGIKGFTQLLRQFNKADELNRFIKILLESVDRLEQFSSLALSITSLKLDSYKMNIAPFEIKSCVTNAIKLWSSYARERKLKVRWQSSEEDVMVKGEEELISQAIGIVIQNAIKHTKVGREISIHLESDESYCTITIQDQGKGFSDKIIEQGAELFSVDKKHVDLNAGMHLPFVNIIAIAHDGKVEIRNHDTGGEVKMVLPISN